MGRFKVLKEYYLSGGIFLTALSVPIYELDLIWIISIM